MALEDWHFLKFSQFFFYQSYKGLSIFEHCYSKNIYKMMITVKKQFGEVILVIISYVITKCISLNKLLELLDH